MTNSSESIQPGGNSPSFSPVLTGEPFSIRSGFSALQFRHDRFPPRAMSPFVLVDHFHMLEPTFDVHPHAGMSAVTLVFEDTRGEMRSRDTVGHNSTFGAGDLHWTLAGRGILHTQLPVGRESHIHALQIFVNLPARLKQLPPDSFRVAAHDMPNIRGAGHRLRVVAGEFAGRASPAPMPQEVLMLDGYLEGGAGTLDVPLPASWNAWVLVVEGQMIVDGAGTLSAGHSLCAGARLGPSKLSLSSEAAIHFVILAGPQIDEPVLQRGPFVFENEEALGQAMADYQAGKFGEIDR